MVPFGGWDMPVEYSGLIAEHQAVRTAAGLFDVSHMGEFEVAGPGALSFLQRVTANNVAKLGVGQAQYSALPMASGCPVDDIIVYRRGDERYLVVVNAANIAKDWEWLRSQQPTGCSLDDQSDAFALLALQGPGRRSCRADTLDLRASASIARRGGRVRPRGDLPHRLHGRGRLRGCVPRRPSLWRADRGRVRRDCACGARGSRHLAPEA
jgi:aminomethyltransferase